MGNVAERWNQKEMLEIKIYIAPEIKNAFDGLSSRQAITLEIISKLEYINGNYQK